MLTRIPLKTSGFMIAVLIMTTGLVNRAQAQWTGPDGNNNIYYNGGNVGIGTANPGGLLELWKANSLALYITRDASGGSGKNQTLALGIDGPNGRAYIDSTHYTNNGYPLDFRVRSITRMTIDTSGNVGIGTTNPQALLHVGNGTASAFGSGAHPIAWPKALVYAPTGGSDSVVTGLLIDSDNGGTNYDRGVAIDLGYSHPSYGYYTSRIVHYGYAAATVGSRLQIQTHSPALDSWNTGLFMNEYGNVGIGNTNPQALLHVGNGTASAFGSGAHPIGWPKALVYAPTSGAGVVTGLLIDSDNGGTNYDRGVAIDLGYSNPSYGYYTSRIVHYGYAAATVGSRLQIQTHSTALDSWNTGLFMNESGNVGIGTTSPFELLDLNGGTFRVQGQNSAPSSGAGVEISYASGTGYLQSYDRGSNANRALYISGSSIQLNAGEGNVGIGGPADSNYKLNVAGNINSTQTITGNNIVAKYQDVAEWVPSSEQLSAGTVVVLDSTKSNHVTSSSVSYDTRVAGVVSEQPGLALGEKSDNKVLVATTGRVRVKVDASKGPIHIGDLLVTSDVPGMAMKSEPIMIGVRQIHAPGTLIGKALEPLEKGKGEILVLLSLQ